MDNSNPKMSRELLERLMSNNSSPQARAVGVSSSEPFARRRQTQAEGRYVRGYRDSHLFMQGHVRQPGLDTNRSRLASTGNERQQHIDTKSNRPSAGFKEPPSRNYDPYGH